MKESIEYKGYKITVRWEADQDMGEPWKENDGHGIVSEWTRRDKAPGERVLVKDDHGHSRRYYDVAGTMELARKDGWGLGEKALAKLAAEIGHKPTEGEITSKAVDNDFEYLRAWCNGEWCWMFRDVRIYKSVSDTTLENVGYHDSLGGIDGTDETVKQYTKEAFEDAKRWLDNELSESEDAACRDIATV